jgi:hypothetical protein
MTPANTPVTVLHGLIAGRQSMVPGGRLVVAGSLGGRGFGTGADRGQAGFAGAAADLAELVADPSRRPGRFDRVGIAQVQEPAIWHAADVGPVDGTEGGQDLIPGCPPVRRGRGGFGPDRIRPVVVAGQFPVRADRSRAPLPVQPVHRVPGHRPERAGRPGQGVPGGVLADPVLAGVYQRRDLGEVAAASGVGDDGDLSGPRPRRQRDERAEAIAEAGVNDSRDVAGPGQVPLGDSLGQDTGGVQAGQFGGAQGAPQPAGLVAGFGTMLVGQGGHEQVAVALLAGRGGLGSPDRMQDREVVGVSEGLVAGLGGRLLLAVMVQDRGEHAQRRARRCRPGSRGGDAGSFGQNFVVPGQFGSRLRSGHRVGKLGGEREHISKIGVGAAGQRDIGMLAVLGAGDHRQAGMHGAALGRVVGDRVAQLGILVAGVAEGPAGPAALPGLRSGSRARRTRSPSRVTASMRSRSPGLSGAGQNLSRPSVTAGQPQPPSCPGECTREDGLDRTCSDQEAATIGSRDISGQDWRGC